MGVVALDAAVHFFTVGRMTFPSLFLMVSLPGPSPSSARCLICSYVSFIFL